MTKTKLDPIWMSALGFGLIESGKIAFLQWRNEKLNFQLRDTDSINTVVNRYTEAVERATVRQQQNALRSALLPALGLEEHGEHDNYGDEIRHYIRIES